jgi:hypothetical protein
MRTYDPMMVAAAVVHPASLHLVNIIIVCYNLHIMKIDDPKAFCQGELLYPIYANVPPGVRNLPKYAPWGKKTRWKVLGAIYGLIQASLKYFIKSSEVLKGIGFMQCPFDMALFCKWFPSGRVALFWQHVDDRYGGFADEEDVKSVVMALHAQLGSLQEPTTMVLGHDNEYDRLKGVMRWRCTTKINAFFASEQMMDIKLHSTPLTKDMAAELTHENCPSTLEERDKMKSKVKAYRKYTGFFSYSAQVVHVECKNVARLFSRFMQNPGEKHYEAIIYALGYLMSVVDECMEYRRPEGFDGSFHLLIMVDADLGGDHSAGQNSSSTMAGVAYLENNHCYSYSKSIKAVVMSTFHSEMYALVEGTQMAIYTSRAYCDQ